MQLVLQGVPYQKPRHTAGSDTVGLDLGPSSIAIVPRQGEARSSRCAPSCVRMRVPSAACSVKWSGNGAPPTLSATTRGVARSSAAKGLPREAEPPLPAHPTAQGNARAQACSPPQEPAQNSPTRSWHWATPSSPRSFPIKAGRNATAEAWSPSSQTTSLLQREKRKVLLPQKPSCNLKPFAPLQQQY